MHRTASLLVLGFLLFASACVLSPNWGEESNRRDPINFRGMSAKPNASLRIQAWNHGLGAFRTLSTFTGSATRYASSPDLYGWTRNGILIQDAYWVPPGAGCETGGMANLRVQERNTDGSWSDLATFDMGGEDCIYDHMVDGMHPVAAGNACKRDDPRIVLFAPPEC